jgi:lipopolysaccharide transport system permease protein
MVSGAMSMELAPERVIEAGRAEREYWRNVWRYRELLYFLAWRDVIVRYKQTVLGVAWAVIRPLLTIAIFVIVFGRIANLPSDGVPYVLLVCAGMLPWQLFANALGDISNSLLNNANLIAKVAFPRIVVPISASVAGFVDFVVSLVILAILMAWYEVAPTWRLALLPLFVGWALAAAVGIGLFMAALNVRYRDFRYIVPFALQFGLYATPVGFSTSAVPETWRWLFALNPMTGAIDGFRWCVLGQGWDLFWPEAVIEIPMIVATLAFGVWFFRRYEQDMVDVI